MTTKSLPMGVLLCAVLVLPSFAQDDALATGPGTEKRFPSLQVPMEFRATLFACDPLVEYPSAIALGAERDSVFVAIDYMTGLGKEIVRRDEIRLVKDTNHDGYADEATVYATGFNSIEGLTFHDGAVYVMHAPLLTRLRDTTGDGKADERRDLVNGLGLTPEENPVRLHCANGLIMGIDGWLYLALGDHGCQVDRPEGDRLVFNGGGILRCRPDGRDLHVFARGLRNIYDVALDAEGSVFVRDNENDGGDYMIRVCASFFGADHGYPYLYRERPDEALAPLADLGRGSSAGGLCYLEPTFPKSYHGNLFFCEWGRAVVRYPLAKKGSGYGPVQEIDFATTPSEDPYGFKPTDLVVDRNGALFVADWADGQRPKRGRGRIYRITSKNEPKSRSKPTKLADWLAQLDSQSYRKRLEAQNHLRREGDVAIAALEDALQSKRLGKRARMHAVWILALEKRRAVLPLLFDLLKNDADTAVRLQAVRAVADLTDPVLLAHRLDAGPGSAKTAQTLANLVVGQNDAIKREIVIALGRLQWVDAPDWLHTHVKNPDAALAHAAMQTLRRSKNWSAVSRLLDRPSTPAFRKVVLRSLSGQYEPALVDGLLERLAKEQNSENKKAYASVLSRLYKKPGPWTYWGYHPAPRPPHSVAWRKTPAIANALNEGLRDPDHEVRRSILERMQRETVPVQFDVLRSWLDVEHDANRTALILSALNDRSINEVRPLLVHVLRDAKHTDANRSTALAMFASGLSKADRGLLMKIAVALEDGHVLAETLRRLARWSELRPAKLLREKLRSPSADVRSAAIDGLVALRETKAAPAIVELLSDKESQVVRSAVLAVGKLGIASASDSVFQLAAKKEVALDACLDSLRLLKDPRAIPLAEQALKIPGAQLAGLRYLRDLGGPERAKSVVELARRSPSIEVVPLVVQTLAKWGRTHQQRSAEMDQRIAQTQGTSGVFLRWHTTTTLGEPDLLDAKLRWQEAFATGRDARLTLPKHKLDSKNAVWLARSGLWIARPQNVQMLTSADVGFRIWLNGRLVYQRKQASTFRPDSDRFEVELPKGTHRLVVALTPTAGKPTRFHLRFRRVSSKSEHEQLIRSTLAQRGNSERGREIFFDVKKSQCLKCHRLGNEGERIGPELIGIGKRFSRIHLIESVLEPSRSIAPSYESTVVQLESGQVLTGVRIAQTPTTWTLADKEGKKHVVQLADIDSHATVAQSIMPDGLERQWTVREFVDLIAFLESQK